MPANILVISNYRDYHAARPEAEIFISLAQQGFHIHIMTYADAVYVPHFEMAGIHVIPFHPEKKLEKSEIRKIRRALIDHRIDILHLFNGKAIVNGIQAAKGIPVQVVVYRGYTGNVHWYDPTAYLKYLHPRVDCITCNARGVERNIRKQLLFRKDKATTIYKGHDLDWYTDYEPAPVRTEQGIPEDAFILVNVANNRKMKGIPWLLKAFNLLPPDLPIHLLLVGRDMDTRQNMQIIRNGKNKARIHLAGFRKDAINIIAACDAFVLSSLYGEGFNKAVVESMCMGVPVIISHIPGNDEMIVDGESGILYPAKDSIALKDAILKLFHNRPLAKSMAEAARDRIRTHFSHKRSVMDFRHLYETLLAKR